MEREIKKRLKWWRRYKLLGIEGLQNQSRRPHHSPNCKIGKKEEQLILKLRQSRNLGARRLQCELKRLHNLPLAIATIHKVLTKRTMGSA